MNKKFLFIIFTFILFLGFGFDVKAEELKDGVYAISSMLDNNKVLDIKADNPSSGDNVELNTFNHSDTQKWNVKKLDEGYYIITSVLDDSLSLDAFGISKNNGANIGVWDYKGSDNQKWIIKDAGDGYFNIISKSSDLYVDVSGANINNGANIITWQGHGGTNQKFKFFIMKDDDRTIADGTYIINSSLTSHSAISLASEASVDTNINLQETNSSYLEAFDVKYIDNGYYSISPYLKDDKFIGTIGSNVEVLNNDYKWLIRKNLDDTYSIFNSDNYCLDVAGANSRAETNILLYQSHGGVNQKFTFTKADFSKIEDGLYTISSFVNDDMVVSLNNEVAVNGANVYLSDKNNSNNQKWYFKNIKDNIYEISSGLNDNFVFDVVGAGTQNGVNVQLYESKETEAQRWYAVKLEDGYYHFTNIKSFKNLDIFDGGIKGGSNIEQYENNYGNAQKFKLTKTEAFAYKQIIDNGDYIIYSAMNLDKSLRQNYIYDVEGSANEIINIKYIDKGFYVLKNGSKAYTNNNGKVIMSNYTGNDTQKWYLVKNNEFYIFYSKVDGKVIDIPYANVSNGINLITWNKNGGDNQNFYLEAVKSVDLDSGYYSISLDDKSFSIDSDVAFNRSKVLMKENKKGDTQKWYLNRIHDNLYEIKYGLNINKVLDVMGGSSLDGTDVIVYTLGDGDNQKWFIVRLKDGGYKLISKSSHKVLTISDDYAKVYSHGKKNKQSFEINRSEPVSFGKTVADGYYTIISSLNKEKSLDVAGASTTNGSNVLLYSLHKDLNQVWKLNYLENGLYKVTSALNPKKTLTNYNGNIQINNYTGDDTQKWYIQMIEKDKVSFISLSDGLYIDVAGANMNNGTNIIAWQGHGGDNQKFILDSYGNTKTYKGIDISRWQGNINWKLLAKENPHFIIMRVGRGIKDLGKDVKFEEYYKNATSYDIPVGVYIYSFASNLNEAKDEANYVLKWLDGKNLDLPVFYDMEYSGQLYLGKEVLTKIAESFCSVITLNNYHCGVYANVYWLTNFLDGKEISSKYPLWLAHWTGANDYNSGLLSRFQSSYSLSPYQYWQFTDKGVYSGITENTVDLDFGYNIFD